VEIRPRGLRRSAVQPSRRLLVDGPAPEGAAPLFRFRAGARDETRRDARRDRRRVWGALGAALVAHTALGALAALLWAPTVVDPGRPGGSGDGGLIAIERVYTGLPSGDAASDPDVRPVPAAETASPPEAPSAPAAEPAPPPPVAPAASAPPEPVLPAEPTAPMTSSVAPAIPVAADPAPATAPRASAGTDRATGAPAGAGDGGTPGGDARDGRDEVDRVAMPIEPVRPEYPRRERLLGREADVELALEVDANGRVRAVEVVRSAGERFDRASVDAVRRTRFRPAVRDGRPVRSRVGYTVRYRLDG
jgi:protein TonB